LSITSFIYKTKNKIEKSISEILQKYLGNVQYSFALSYMASLSDFFHSGRSSNKHKCSTKEKEKEWVSSRTPGGGSSSPYMTQVNFSDVEVQ
jgi:hypothetical protein